MMIRRQKTTIFTDAKENTSVMELKRILEGILKVAPDNQKLFKDDTEMEDTKTLQVRNRKVGEVLEEMWRMVDGSGKVGTLFCRCWMEVEEGKGSNNADT